MKQSDVLEVLSSEGLTVEERVRRLEEMRGMSMSRDQLEAAMKFLEGKNRSQEMTADAVHWLADEVLTVLRLQEPPQDDLAARLGEVAFGPETDPVVRDYIMQHLGHLWEQNGARPEIESALWRALGVGDETTPGSALIALNRGYERDRNEAKLQEVRQRALELAQNENASLGVRVTALAVAGEEENSEVRMVAENILQRANVPLILKTAAARIAESHE